MEGIDVLLRRKTRFAASEIEADDAGVAPLDGQLRRLHGIGRVHVAHRADDQAPFDPEVFLAALQALDRGGDHLVLCQCSGGVQAWGKAHLRVYDPVHRHVLDELVGHPLQRLRGLHDAGGLGETFQILGQVAFLGSAVKPFLQLGLILGG